MNRSTTVHAQDAAAQHLCNSDSQLARLITLLGPLSYQTPEDGYRFLVETIIGQMLSAKVADVLTQRLIALCNGSIALHTIDRLNYEQIRGIGLSNGKIKAIRSLSEAIASQQLNLTQLAERDDEDIMASLTAIYGIGNWTAKMYLLFALNRPDVLPFEDAAFLQAYRWLYQTDDREIKQIKDRCSAWRPYSSLAARYLYQALDQGLTLHPFHWD